MFYEYIAILIGIVFAIFLASTFWSLSHFLGPKRPQPEKMIPYECGSETKGTRYLRFPMKFFPAGVVFLLFDVSLVFLYLWAVVLKFKGWKCFLSALPLIIIIFVSLFYSIRKGVFEWRI